MSFHNVPPNGFPDLPDVEELAAVEKDVKTLKTTTTEQGAAITALGTAKAAKADIAPTFSAESNYAVGDLVYYEGALYECTTEHEAAAWDAEDFTAVSIDDELSSLKSGLNDVNSKITDKSNLKLVQKGTTSTSIAALYQETSVGEEVTYNVNVSSNLSDYPSDLSSAGAIYYPQINIKKYGGEYGFIMIQAAIVDGTPKAIFGYYNNGTCQWGSVI